MKKARLWIWVIAGIICTWGCEPFEGGNDSDDGKDSGNCVCEGASPIAVLLSKQESCDGADASCIHDYANGDCQSVSHVSCTLNPYETVDWAIWGQYKANFHAHTTNSDGVLSPATVIDEYHSAGYAILAITDHNYITWPWTDYGRDPAALGMLAVRGDEYSESDHLNAFYDFQAAIDDLKTGISHAEDRGGLSHFNHPGRYSTPSDWACYIPWFRKYPSCVGMEVYNNGDRYPDDRRLWDNINEHYYELQGKLVFGYSNDDEHNKSHMFRNFQYMLMPELTEQALRTAQQTGAFYFSYEPGGSGDGNVPRIDEIIVDNKAKTITINATNYESISWIGPGTRTVETGRVFEYSHYAYIPFVRAVLKGSRGDSFTQPFGFRITS